MKKVPGGYGVVNEEESKESIAKTFSSTKVSNVGGEIADAPKLEGDTNGSVIHSQSEQNKVLARELEGNAPIKQKVSIWFHLVAISNMQCP